MKNLWQKLMVALGYRSKCCGAPIISALDLSIRNGGNLMTYDQSYCDELYGGCGKRCDNLK